MRDDQRAFTRQRLQEAALEVIERTGYPGSHDRRDRRHRGRQPCHLYLHFKSKADLIRELVETMPDRQHVWDELSAMRNPSPEEVRAWLEDVVAMYDTHRLYFLAVEQAVSVEAELTEDYYRQVDHYLDNAAAALHEDTEDARLHLMLLWVQLSRLSSCGGSGESSSTKSARWFASRRSGTTPCRPPPVRARHDPRHLPIV